MVCSPWCPPGDYIYKSKPCAFPVCWAVFRACWCLIGWIKISINICQCFFMWGLPQSNHLINRCVQIIACATLFWYFVSDSKFSISGSGCGRKKIRFFWLILHKVVFFSSFSVLFLEVDNIFPFLPLQQAQSKYTVMRVGLCQLRNMKYGTDFTGLKKAME